MSDPNILFDEEELSRREQANLANANYINAILSQSSIKEAAESAHQRTKAQAVAKQRAVDNTDKRANLEASLASREGEGRLNRAAAQNRADTMATNLTAGQRGDITDLTQGIALIDSLSGDLDNFTASGGTTGGTGGATEWVAEQLGFDPATNYVQQRREAANPGLTELRAKAASVSASALSATMKGVMTDQDFKRVKAMDLNNPNLDPAQLRSRIAAARSIMVNSLRSRLGGQIPQGPAENPVQQQPALSPAVAKYLR